MTVATNSHIVIDDRGRPRVAAHGLPVEYIVAMHLQGHSPQEIIEQGWSYLTMSELHSALAYYYDHKPEMDATREAEDREFDALRAAAIASGQQPTRAELERRLREQGKSL